MYVPNKFFEDFLEKYIELEACEGRLEDRAEKAKAKGDMEAYLHLDRKCDLYTFKLDGMTVVLEMLGYELHYRHGKPFIIQKGAY